jgi:hypothetical protein
MTSQTPETRQRCTKSANGAYHAKRKIECNCKPFSMHDTPLGRTQPATIDRTPPPRTDAETGLSWLPPVEPSPICTSNKRSKIKCVLSITKQKATEASGNHNGAIIFIRSVTCPWLFAPQHFTVPPSKRAQE